MRTPGLLLVILAAMTAACVPWRWSGYPPEARAHDATGDVRTSTSPFAVPSAIPPTPDERFKTAEFYSDLGPDKIDVSSYPTQQQYNYGVFERACSRCHTLARPINAPMVGRGWWEFYMLGMRVRSKVDGRPLDKNEVREVLDFLEYDSRVRKVERANDFDRSTEELKKRFDRSVSARISDLQKGNPRSFVRPEP